MLLVAAIVATLATHRFAPASGVTPTAAVEAIKRDSKARHLSGLMNAVLRRAQANSARYGLMDDAALLPPACVNGSRLGPPAAFRGQLPPVAVMIPARIEPPQNPFANACRMLRTWCRSEWQMPQKRISICTSCGVLVGVNDPTCYNCGRRNPGLWGYGKALRALAGDGEAATHVGVARRHVVPVDAHAAAELVARLEAFISGWG